jgi:acetyltransferase-like isoleucine patch superfamily enzyme
VNGSLVKQDGGGRAIYWKNSGTKIKTRFVDLRIENCHLYRCERNGINSSGYTSRSNWYPSVGIIIRNNLLEQIPGDGIVPIGCDGAIIEHNIMRDSPDILPSTEAAAGIWPWSSDNTIIQYNEVSGHNAKIDGQGLDSDWNCQNTIIQYNYSHDNAGGFLLVCNNGTNIGTNSNIGTTNTIVRYNVSINDGIRLYPTRKDRFFSPLMHISGPVSNTQIYNNLFIVPAKPNDSIDISLIQMDNWGGPWPVDSRFANNIFYIEKKADFSWGSAVNTRFDNNLFKGQFDNLPVINNGPIFSDPMILNPDARGIGLYMLINFKLKSGSPCIGTGIRIDNNGGYDLFGNSLGSSGLPSIGVHEYK